MGKGGKREGKRGKEGVEGREKGRKMGRWKGKGEEGREKWEEEGKKRGRGKGENARGNGKGKEGREKGKKGKREVKIHIKKKILQSLCRLQKPLKYTYFLSCGFGKKYDSERGEVKNMSLKTTNIHPCLTGSAVRNSVSRPAIR